MSIKRKISLESRFFPYVIVPLKVIGLEPESCPL